MIDQSWIKSLLKVEQLIFIILIVCSLVGVWITDASPTESHGYWMLMVFVFSIAAISSCWWSTKKSGQPFMPILFNQAIHWIAVLVAVMTVYSLWHTGLLDKQEVGLVILVVLALGTFLSGSQAGWRFYALGLLLALITVISAYLDEFIGPVILIAVLFVAFTIYWTRRKSSQ